MEGLMNGTSLPSKVFKAKNLMTSQSEVFGNTQVNDGKEKKIGDFKFNKKESEQISNWDKTVKKVSTVTPRYETQKGFMEFYKEKKRQEAKFAKLKSGTLKK